MRQRLEISGGFRRDEDEACVRGGDAEQEAALRVSLPLPKKKPDPFQDVDLPKKKPDPFQDVEDRRPPPPRKPRPY